MSGSVLNESWPISLAKTRQSPPVLHVFPTFGLWPTIECRTGSPSRSLPRHGVEPTKVVEADREDVISSLVISGIGLALMREDVALEKAAAGEVCLWKDVRIPTTLWFIYLQERGEDPVIRVLLDMRKSPGTCAREEWARLDSNRRPTD